MNALRLLLVYIRIVMGRELRWLIGWVGLAVAG